MTYTVIYNTDQTIVIDENATTDIHKAVHTLGVDINKAFVDYIKAQLSITATINSSKANI